jgi:adenylate cyclase
LAEKSLSIDDTCQQAHVVIGFFYYYTRKFDEACTKFKRVIKLNPQSPEGYRWLGLTFETLGKPDEAIPYLKKAIRLNPVEPGRTAVLGYAYRNMEMYGEAIQYLRDALRYRPKNIKALVNLAACYAGLGKDEDAIAAVIELKKLDSKFSVEKYSKLFPYKHPENADRFLNLLRKAGLPEKAQEIVLWDLLLP